jgi:thymidylate synthase
LTATTVDDLLRVVLDAIRAHGTDVTSSKGDHREITGVLLELLNPRARLSRTETRGKLFSALGELCWYLAGSNDVDFISYYLPFYKTLSEGGIVHGAYGPRLRAWRGQNQLDNVIKVLRDRPTSRQAVIQIFDGADIIGAQKDVPCTCTLQYLIRNDRLDAFTTMRSNDVFWGLAHDVFAFTMLQELFARSLSVEVGCYKHFVGSLHLYQKDTDPINSFLNEGWQPTDQPMPAMPEGDPWPAVASVLCAEAAIRAGGEPPSDAFASVGPYWQDLMRLLQVFALPRGGPTDPIRALRAAMQTPIYDPFIDSRLA